MSEISPEPSALLFQPAPGGDITLSSSDGTTFRVHSVLMSLASSVFKDMLSVGAKSDEIITLAEDAKLASLMLEYIYPTKTPIVTSLPVFEQALKVAQKYDIKGMTDTLDGQLCLGAKNELVSANPLHACILAYSFGLMKAAEIIARVVDLKVNLRNATGLVMLKELPVDSELLMRLVGMQAMRADTLADILFTYDQYPMNGHVIGHSTLQRCSKCTQESSMTVPTWILRWSKSVYELALRCDLKELPLDSKIETPTTVVRLVDYHEYCDALPMSCLDCVALAHTTGNEYFEWADGVVRVIDSRLSGLHSQLSLSPI